MTELLELLPMCNKETFILFKNQAITFKQFKVRIWKQKANKKGQSLQFTTLDDLRPALDPRFLATPTGMDAMLSHYLEAKKSQYKPGFAPIECYDVNKLRLIENVPFQPRCFRSLGPSKPKPKRVPSARIGGFSQVRTIQPPRPKEPPSEKPKEAPNNMMDMAFLRRLQLDGHKGVLMPKSVTDLFEYMEQQDSEVERLKRAEKFIKKVTMKPRPY